MVMKRNAMRRNLRQSIIKSFGRYIAIAAIIALGSGLFVGLLMSKTDMVATGQAFTDRQNMFDFRLISNYGWTEEYVERTAKLEGVADAEGVHYLDLIARVGDSDEDAVYRFYSIPEKVNRVELRGGRLPEADNECLADGYSIDDNTLGQTITISSTNEEDALDAVRHKTFTIVGYVATPLYMDNNRGTTSVGSGSLENYYYIPKDAFDLDYYTEINITIPGDYGIYSDAYENALDTALDTLEPQAEELAKSRFEDVKGEAEDEYNEGYQEYLDGVKEYEDAKAEAEQELADALKELQDAEQELADNRKKLIQAENDIKKGEEALELARGQYESNKKAFEEQKAAAEPQLAAYKQTLDAQYPTVKSACEAAKDAVSQAQAAFDNAAANYDAESSEYIAAQTALEQAKAGLQQAQSGLQEIEAGYKSIESQKQQLAAAEQQLKDAQWQIWEADGELEDAFDTLMVNWGLWHEGEAELAEGWIEYEDAKLEAETELADAEAELEDARLELADARADIDAMEEWDLYILDRNSNLGYGNLDSSSDIVAGVSRVLPVFFILVASLVCITTMTRMIDEERTQIGTLKALGYSNAAIIGKYMVYSGSGALLGCCLGIWAGCTVFPQIIWQAYCTMLHIQPDVVLKFDWILCLSVAVVYTAIMLFVTWYCCRRTLQEEPAQLIRPKSPEAGKKILLEYFPLWNKLRFLNKVALRNIFSYRQRLAMMLVGIGGCTALLVTGFGLRDSIVNVVDYQFTDVTLYDLEVYFREDLTEKDRKEFLTETGLQEESVLFYHQSSMEMDFDDQVKEVYMICADERLNGFIHLHSGTEPLPMPGENETVLSVGVARGMGISVGDAVVLRNADMETLELTVSGIYDNHINNFAIISPETIKAQWGGAPEQQMAFVQLSEDQDVHSVSADVTDLNMVMNVSVSEDMAGMVRNMMDALDLVVILVVFCAGLLAVIVLYNLTNININERIREIATIKVLGFNASETGSYVFKENMILTVAGALLGLMLGNLLLSFVMSQIKIDLVWFKAQVQPMSYVWSIGLTLLSSIIVDFVFYFKLQKINMAEALKSVE